MWLIIPLSGEGEVEREGGREVNERSEDCGSEGSHSVQAFSIFTTF